MIANICLTFDLVGKRMIPNKFSDNFRLIVTAELFRSVPSRTTRNVICKYVIGAMIVTQFRLSTVGPVSCFVVNLRSAQI